VGVTLKKRNQYSVVKEQRQGSEMGLPFIFHQAFLMGLIPARGLQSFDADLQPA